MDRHPTDLVALLFGLFFLAIGGGYIVHEVMGDRVDAVWVLAVAMTAVGSAFLAVTLAHRRRPGELGDGEGGGERTG